VQIPLARFTPAIYSSIKKLWMNLSKLVELYFNKLPCSILFFAFDIYPIAESTHRRNFRRYSSLHKPGELLLNKAGIEKGPPSAHEQIALIGFVIKSQRCQHFESDIFKLRPEGGWRDIFGRINILL
jgi:hypothetical protein